MKLRLVDSGPVGLPGALNMGIDEALIASVGSFASPPTLRFYTWSPPCITVGYFQSLEDEVDLEACRAAGVDVVRRLTGGGAVFHETEITYSIVIPRGHELAPDDILESYRRICAGLVAGLARLGVAAEFAPINDIAVGGRKISGNAQTRRGGTVLQHGTILLGLDPGRMFALLKVPAEKLRGKLIKDAKARVTSLRDLLGREVGYGEVAAALKQGFVEAWSAEMEPGDLCPTEKADARRLAAERFARSGWNERK